MKGLFLALMLAHGLAWAGASPTPSPTPAEKPTPVTDKDGNVLTRHEQKYEMQDTQGDIYYMPLTDLPELKGAGMLQVIVENTQPSELGCNLSSSGGGTNRSVGKNYFYHVAPDETFYWDGKGGILTLIWWSK